MLLLLLTRSNAAVAQDLHGLFGSSLSTTQSKSSEGTQADFQSLRETFDVNWSTRVSPTLGYRLLLRGERADDTSVLRSNGVKTSTDTSLLLLQPALDVTLASVPYSLNAGLRLRNQFTEDSRGGELTLNERNEYLRFFYSSDLLPSLGVLVDRTTSSDTQEPLPRDEVNTRYQVTSQYSRGGFNLGYNFGRQVREDHREQRTQTQDTNTGSAGYAGAFFDSRLLARADLSVNETRTVEEFFAPGIVRLSRPLAQGLRAGPDPTPTNSADVPVVNEPGLVSGTANIPLVLLSAVGFGFAAPQQVTEVSITLAPEPPFVLPANLASFLAFRVFSTDDPALTAWTEIVGVTGVFDQAKSQFTLTFPATTARFFKVYVSQNTFGVLVKATGIAAPTTAEVSARSERSRSTSGATISTGLAYTPVKWLTAAYNASLATSTQEPESVETRTGTQAFSLTVRPHETVTTTGTVQYGFSESNQAGAVDTTQRSYGLSASWVPLKTLTTTLALGRNERRTDGELQDLNDAASLSAAAKVFPGLNVDSSYAVSKGQTFTPMEQEVFTQDISLRMAAQVSPRISMVGNYGVQIQDTTPAPAGMDATRVTYTAGGGTVYTFSRIVNFTTRFDFVATTEGTRLSQQYRLDWVPTPKMSVFVSYMTTTAHFSEVVTTSDTVSLNGRWSINQALDLSANYSFARAASGDRLQEIQSFNMAANLRF